MKKQSLFFAVVIALVLGGRSYGQAPAPAPPQASQAATPTTVPPPSASNDWTVAAEAGTPVKLQFLVSKYQGEKKVSSVPYLISTNANQPRATSLRVGARIPIPSGSNINYENIGTSIDCSVSTKGQGLFRTEISLEDSSVYIAEPQSGTTQALSPAAGRPVFRSFKVTNSLVLKDGQTTQMTSAADPITGEVMRVDLTLTVVK